ncbi:MAG: hemerythrin family protein [Gammaproteobacteria bacterium]|uniref:Hemerythrin family protein n=1 Tax=Candidatus Thiopontia autotrophica TaxID=2841688 RepID=A0A8J6PC73_9GAMM|nr:hemerythrin family protein [Candidatus Thiopontia autotrophica]
MENLIWDDSLSVQVEEIDEDHRKLVELFNILLNSVADNDSHSYINAVIEELISCTIWHFRHEERLMLKHGYEGMSDHKQEHADLVESGKNLQQKVLHDDGQVSIKDIEFLEQWLTGHILGADMELGSYLSERM